MALWGKSIHNFLEIWCLNSGFRRFGHLSLINHLSKKEHWLASQPPTEKVLTFNMIYYDSTIFFSKYHNKAELKNLNISEVLNSNFADLAASVTSTASTTLAASILLPHFIKKNYSDGWIISDMKMTNTGLFL